jgi:molybdopterin molybdotransferase
MDGYAVRSADVRQLPVRLHQIGESRAGARFVGALQAGTCVRIFTGAIVPENADVIALQEDASSSGDEVEIREAPEPGRHIRKAGLDFVTGSRCAATGDVLNARQIGLLAASGHSSVLVRRQPKIAILSTGDELVPPGRSPTEDQIIGSNSVALSAVVRSWGGIPTDLGIAGDQTASIAAAIEKARDSDLLVTTGGASVGDHDLVQQALGLKGFELSFWRIAMRPGKPLMFGKVGDLPVLSLPGNPVSALVCALLFLRPAMAAMQGERRKAPLFQSVPLASPLAANDQREDYLRARVDYDETGRSFVEPYPVQDSSMLMAFVKSNALIRRPAFAPPALKGDYVDVINLELSDSL